MGIQSCVTCQSQEHNLADHTSHREYLAAELQKPIIGILDLLAAVTSKGAVVRAVDMGLQAIL